MNVVRSFEQMQQPYVMFDANNPEHVKAFEMQCLGISTDGGEKKLCLHRNLRFRLEAPFTDLRSMMFHKIGEAYVAKLQEVAAA